MQSQRAMEGIKMRIKAVSDTMNSERSLCYTLEVMRDKAAKKEGPISPFDDRNNTDLLMCTYRVFFVLKWMWRIVSSCHHANLIALSFTGLVSTGTVPFQLMYKYLTVCFKQACQEFFPSKTIIPNTSTLSYTRNSYCRSKRRQECGKHVTHTRFRRHGAFILSARALQFFRTEDGGIALIEHQLIP